MNKKKIALFLSLIVLFSNIIGPLPSKANTFPEADPGKQVSTRQSEVAQQIIVELNGVEPETIAEQVGAKVVKKGPLNFATLTLEAGKNPDQVINQLKTHRGVVSVERNHINKISSINIGDPLFKKEYNLNIANVPEAWSNGATGQGMTIAIVDTGVDLNHPDLKGNLVPGYNAILESTAKSTTQDDNGHGTHVAGIAAAQLNDIGVVGVAYQAKIMPIKAMDKAGEGADDIIADGIVWAVNHGAKIINMSLGSDAKTAILGSAVEYALEKGVLVFAAAGNFDPMMQTNPGINYPASYPNVIAVTATDANDQIANISATGPESVLAAPGINILSDFWTKNDGSTYATADGTSMATPFVAGVAALIWSKHLDWTADQVRIALEKGAKDLGNPGRDAQYGFGRVDAFQSLQVNDAVQTLSTPANVSALGALVQGDANSQANLLVPTQAFSQKVMVSMNTVTSPENFPNGIESGGTAFSIDFMGTPKKILSLTVQAQMPLNNSNLLGYVYRWSGSRWILVGGGVTSQQIKVGIYEAGIYQVGYTQAIQTARLAGNNRQATAIEISKAAYPAGTDTVLLAREDDFPDALTGVPLAYKEHAPILLTNSQSLSSEVIAEINRLAPKKVILLGSTAALSDRVQTQLSSLGYTINRIGGANRYATASAIANALGTIGRAVVVNGNNFPDALAIASQAAQNGEPILLTDTATLAPETDVALRQLSVTETLVIGGEARVSNLVLGQLPSARRIAGIDRYSTAAYVLSEYPPTGPEVYLATGENFPDALTGGLLAAIQSTSVVLVPPGELTLPLLKTLQSWHGMKVVALGGITVVSNGVLNTLQKMLS